MGIDWLIDMRLARAPLLWVGLLCFSAATFLGTLAHVARLKGLKALRYVTTCTGQGFSPVYTQGTVGKAVPFGWFAMVDSSVSLSLESVRFWDSAGRFSRSGTR